MKKTNPWNTFGTGHKYSPIRFFFIAFFLTWVSWFIAAYFSYQKGGEAYQLLFMFPGLFSPSIAALICLSGSKNKELRKDFLDRLRLCKINWSFLPLLFLLAPFIVLLSTAISLLFGQSVDQFNFSSEFKVMEGHGLLGLFFLTMAPLLEELGWRGYGVDSLRSNFNLFKTTLLFAFLWAMWHVPLFFINGYYHHGLWETNIFYVINFFVSILPAAVLLNWIFYKNNRSITAVVFFHLMINISFVVFQTTQFTKCISTILLLMVSTIILVLNKNIFLRDEI